MPPGCICRRPAATPKRLCRSTPRGCSTWFFCATATGPDPVKAWEVYLQKNCPAPCAIPEAAWQPFQSLQPETVRGENQPHAFTADGLQVYRGGQSLGRIKDPEFARLMLATWLGEAPTTSLQLKAALLAAPESR